MIRGHRVPDRRRRWYIPMRGCASARLRPCAMRSANDGDGDSRGDAQRRCEESK